MSAVKREGQPAEIWPRRGARSENEPLQLGGVLSSRARLHGRWEYPRRHIAEIAITGRNSKDFQTTSEDVAVGSFQHMIREVIGATTEGLKIYVNVSDCRRNSKVQELMLSFQSVWEDVQFEAVDECFSSLVCRISNDASDLTAEGLCCGGLRSLDTGELRPDAPVSATLTFIRILESLKSHRVRHTKCISTTPRIQVPARSTWRWRMKCARSTGPTARNLGMRMCGKCRRPRHDALSMLRSGAVTGAPDTGKEDLRILLTGRGARGPSFRAALKALVSQDFPSASTHEDGETHR